jgi:hypothetical protein
MFFLISLYYKVNDCYFTVPREEDTELSDLELKKLLVYFLDLIEYFTHEKLQMIQDPSDDSRYALTGDF